MSATEIFIRFREQTNIKISWELGALIVAATEIQNNNNVDIVTCDERAREQYL